MNYILSVLIPTRNRLEYLAKCVPQVLGACSSNIQVVVHDNSDEVWADSEKYLEKYPNFLYRHVSGILSFVDNFSQALEYAQGKYCCFIGDDDGILPEIEELAVFMNQNNINAVSQNISVTYFWPNDLKAIRNTENGLLKIFYASNHVEKRSTDKELKRLLKTGCQGYLERGLVKPYHGVVRTELFKKLKETTGHYIDGLSPDIYASVSLSCLIDKVYVINYPITISGIGAKSGSAASATGAHTGKLADAPHFKGHADYKWDGLVPQMYSVETIWADSALHAFRNFSDLEVDAMFGKEYILKTCKKKYPQFKDEYKTYKKSFNYNYLRLFGTLISEDFFAFAKRALRRLSRKNNDFIQITDVPDIIEAGEKVKEKLQSCDFEKTLVQLV